MQKIFKLLASLKCKVRSCISSITSLLTATLFIAFFIFIYVAQIKSCFFPSQPSTNLADRSFVEPESSNVKHIVVLRAFHKVWNATKHNSKPELYIETGTEEINAYSYGNGLFTVTEPLADLPEWAVESIMAHEIAHDSLHHSKKISGIYDLMDWIGEVFSLIAGSTQEHEDEIKTLLSMSAVPRYSQAQEYEADMRAILILKHADYNNPEEILANTFKILLNQYGDIGGGFFDSHPATSDRIEKILATRKINTDTFPKHETDYLSDGKTPTPSQTPPH